MNIGRLGEISRVDKVDKVIKFWKENGFSVDLYPKPIDRD